MRLQLFDLNVQVIVDMEMHISHINIPHCNESLTFGPLGGGNIIYCMQTYSLQFLHDVATSAGIWLSVTY